MDNKDIKALLDKYKSGTASEEEIRLLESWYMHYTEHNTEQISAEERLQTFSAVWDNLEEVTQKPKWSGWNWTWTAAASILLVLSVGLFKLNNHSTHLLVKNEITKNIKLIVPGSNKAILTLSNGATVNLAEASDGVIAAAEKVKIIKQKNGQLVYDKVSVQDNSTEKVLYNTISTPYGGQYQVVLPDGTNVWLNAASSLKYPVKFTGHERHVELSGEAYFEVAKNKSMPFTIKANNTNVKVLGTHFNIMAYNDEATTKTTLLEGSVQLSFKNKQVVLVPGQQGEIINAGTGIGVSYINTDDAVAWKNGYFKFSNENVVSIMKKVARWYDVEVEFHGDMSQVRFGGSISRTKNIEELLKKIQLTGSVNFKIQGRRVIVSI